MSFKELCRRQEALQVVQDPMEQLNAHGRAYIRFAIENPHYYHLMFLSDSLQSLAERKTVFLIFY
ncbi:MAG: TetR-like C-terminal domain-containing protein [Candidatus Thermochlorobacter sp.]